MAGIWCSKNTLGMTMWGILVNQRQGFQPSTFAFLPGHTLQHFPSIFEDTCRGIDWGSGFSCTLAWYITSAQHTLHNAKCPEVWVPGLAMGIGLSIGNTHWKRTQDWKLKARELKWAPVLRAQALNPLRYQASFILVVAIEIGSEAASVTKRDVGLVPLSAIIPDLQQASGCPQGPDTQWKAINKYLLNGGMNGCMKAEFCVSWVSDRNLS